MWLWGWNESKLGQMGEPVQIWQDEEGTKWRVGVPVAKGLFFIFSLLAAGGLWKIEGIGRRSIFILEDMGTWIIFQRWEEVSGSMSGLGLYGVGQRVFIHFLGPTVTLLCLQHLDQDSRDLHSRFTLLLYPLYNHRHLVWFPTLWASALQSKKRGGSSGWSGFLVLWVSQNLWNFVSMHLW